MNYLLSLGFSKMIVMGVALILSLGLLIRYINETRRRKIVLQRKDTTSSETKYVRRSDLMKQSPEQNKTKSIAKHLIDEGKIAEAAQLFEKSGLHRDAISLLENFGKIDEACGVLLRMNKPLRAGAVYARHGIHSKAGDCFVQGNDQENAAKEYIEAGKSEQIYFEKAALIYENNGSIEQAVSAYIYANAIEKAVALSLKTNNCTYLLNYMSKKQTAKTVIGTITYENLALLIEKLPSDEASPRILALWTDLLGTMEIVALCLRKIHDNSDLLCLYWQLLPYAIIDQTVKYLVQYTEIKNNETLLFMTKNASALFKTGRFALAAQIYKHAQRFAMAAKSWAHAGNIDKCIESLKCANDPHLLKRCNDALEASKHLQEECYMAPGQWHPKTVETICRALEEIDPDNDAHILTSPFSMAA